jgi:hypothetical protein
LGPIDVPTLHIWKHGALTTIEDGEYVSTAVWSDDNRLAIQVDVPQGDVGGPSHINVWDGKRITRQTSDGAHLEQNPVWEPGNGAA